MADAPEPVTRQGMEDRGSFSRKPASEAPRPHHFDHAGEDAEGESGNQEEGQQGHRMSPASTRNAIPDRSGGRALPSPQAAAERQSIRFPGRLWSKAKRARVDLASR